MRVTYYEFPQKMPIREAFMAWKESGLTDRPDPPAGMTDEEVEACWPRRRICNVRTAKKFLRKYGGHAWTEWFEGDGSFCDTTEIRLEGRNRGSYNRI